MSKYLDGKVAQMRASGNNREFMIEVLNDIMVDHELCYVQGQELKKAIEIIKGRITCPECKYYCAPVCTFYKWLPMTSRNGWCYHAIRGKYQGEVPKVEVKDEDRLNRC